MTYLGQVWAIVHKDLTIEFRTKERFAAMASFAVLVGLLFHYALDVTVVRPQDIASGVIWMTVIFSALLGVGRTFYLEEEDGAMSGLLHSPIALDALFVGKFIANYILVAVITVLIFVVFAGFFRLNFGGHFVALIGIVSLGAVGLVGILTLFSAVSSRTRMGESLLPVLAFPLLVPVVVYGVDATTRILVGRPLSEVAGNVRMLAAFALLSIMAGVVLFRFVVEE